MEDVTEFQKWLNKCIQDGKTKLKVTDRALAYILLREGLNYYLRDISKEALNK